MNAAFSPQQAAIDPRVSCWVAASAGTGKTKVLVDRLARLLLEGYAPEKLLCITFTKAAAAEMQQRLLEQLKRWAIADPETLQKELSHLLDQNPSSEIVKRAQSLFFITLDTPGGLKIQTIHSFCQVLLQRFPLEADIDPCFNLISEEKAHQMLSDAQEKVFSAPSEALKFWLTHLTTEFSDGRFEEMLQNLHHQKASFYYFLSCYPSPDDYQQILEQFLNFRETVSPISPEILKHIGQILEKQPHRTDQKLGLKLSEKNDQDLEDPTLFLTKEGTLRKNLTSQAFVKEFPDLYQRLQQQANYHFMSQQNLYHKKIVEGTMAFVHVAKAIFETYQDDKKHQGVLDFEDLIAATNRLLQKPGISDWVFYKLEGGFEHILVDEAQDTSPAQWHVLQQMLSLLLIPDHPHRTLFVVGDIKQSIYSFQGAKPLLFASLQPFFQQELEAQGRPWRSVQLQVSFRTTPAVLNIVDHIFQKHPEGVQFYEKIQHISYRQEAAGLVEIWPALQPLKKEKTEELWPLPLEQKESLTAGALLAQQITTKIQMLLDSKDILPSTGKRTCPGDILILIQRRADWIPLLLQNLKRQQIPVAGMDRLNLKDHLAVLDMIALGRFLCLPQDDYSLACVLKSPLLNRGHGIREEDLFTLCHNRESSLWESLQQHQDQKDVFKDCVDFLKLWLSQVDYASPFALYHSILCQTEKFFIARLGHDCEDVLYAFLQQALAYEQQENATLQGFIDFINDQETEIKRITSPCADQVRIMNVHGAKGLQSPIVILADSGDQPTLQKELFLWHEAEKPLFLLKPPQAYETEVLKGLKQSALDRQSHEQRRLLYVALTRPQDRLYITGLSRRSEPGEWYQIIESILQKVGKPTPEGGWCYQPQNFQHDLSTPYLPQPLWLPTWFTEKPLKQDLWRTPRSAMSKDSNPAVTKSQERGILLHHLFEILGQKKRPWTFEGLFETAQRWWDHHHRPVLLKEHDFKKVIDILLDPAYEVFFGPHSRAEVEIKVADFLGRIDRLAILEDTAFILDYKTSGRVPTHSDALEPAYRQQLNLYREAIQKIDNNFKVRTFLLWTEGPELMEISY